MDYMQPNTARRGPLATIFSFFWGILNGIRQLFFNLLFFVVILIIIAAIGGDVDEPLPEKAALRIAPGGILVDQKSYTDPLNHLLAGNNQDDTETLTRDLVRAIDAAAGDKRISGIVLDLNHLLGGGLSKISEVGEALERFKKSGKPVIASADNYNQDQYLLASYADEIHLHPMGSVLLTGYSSYRNYYKSALDKLKVNYHIFKVGTYKDAIEPLMRDDMSAASREHNSQWLSDLWSLYTGQVEAQRQLDAGSLNQYINKLPERIAAAGGNSAQLALDSGLVDSLDSRVAMREQLQEKFGASDTELGYQAIGIQRYKRYLDSQESSDSNKIGLIVASGTILDGQQPAGSIGGDTLAGLIRDALNDDAIKAIVLRIDSGGGSAFASEVIREQLQAVRDKNIPLVVSMGSVAASGGYWISTASDKVFATPATITGSIGVFGAFPTLENTFSELGIHTDGVGTTKLAGSMRVDRPLSDDAGRVIQTWIEGTYGRFLSLVANARDLSINDVDKIAQGRVWSGARALDNQLVDQLGYLTDAVAEAAKLAKLDHYQLEEIRKPLSLSEQLLQDIASAKWRPASGVGKLIPASLQQLLAPTLAPFYELDAMNDPRGVYIRCVECAAP